MANLTLSQAGITYRETRTRHVPWSTVVDAVLQDGNVHVLLASGKPIARPLSLDNAFLLADLIPELRARWGRHRAAAVPTRTLASSLRAPR